MIGLPTIIAQALMSFMTYGLNIILVKISESAVTATSHLLRILDSKQLGNHTTL